MKDVKVQIDKDLQYENQLKIHKDLYSTKYRHSSFKKIDDK